MRKSMKNRKNTLRKKNTNNRTKKQRGGLGGALRPQFHSYADIAKIDFDIPVETRGDSRTKDSSNQTFGHKRDYYKFLEMAQRNMVTDMKTMLHKIGDYEVLKKVAVKSDSEVQNRGEKLCKFMYLIRATEHDTGASVLHYICNNGSLQMFDLVFPYYMTLYNRAFPQLLGYYLNLKSRAGQISPLGLLVKPIDRKEWTGTATGNALRGTLGALKNLAINPLTSLKNAASSTASGLKRAASSAIHLGNNLNWERVRIYCLMRQFGADKPNIKEADPYEAEFKKSKHYDPNNAKGSARNNTRNGKNEYDEDEGRGRGQGGSNYAEDGYYGQGQGQ